MAITQNQQTPRYLVRDQGEISGPFELNFIEGMVLGGVFPNTVELQKEGSGAWSRFRGVGHLSSSGIDVTVNSGDGRSGNSSVSPATKKPNSSSEVSWLGLVFGITAILAVVLFYIVASSKSDARKAADAQKSAETPKESVKWSNRASPIPPRETDCRREYYNIQGSQWANLSRAEFRLLPAPINADGFEGYSWWPKY